VYWERPLFMGRKGDIGWDVEGMKNGVY